MTEHLFLHSRVSLLVCLGLWLGATIGGTAPAAGQAWAPIGLQGDHIWALATSASGAILAGTADGNGGGTDNKIYRSLDGGASWSVTSGLSAEGVFDIEFDPTDESIVYAGLNGGGVYKSPDGGVSWSWSNIYGQIWEIAISPSHPSVVYLASASGGALKSVDGGGSWIGLGPIGNATAIAVHPSDPDTALLGTPFDGVYRTIDGGASWSQMNAGFGFTPDVRSVLFDPQNPSTVYAGEMWSGVFKSVDGGVSWFKPDPDLFATVEVIKELDGTLYINNTFDDNGNPAYRSSDGGVSWEPLPRQLPDSFFPRSLAVTPDTVLLGTMTVPETDHVGGVFAWGAQEPVDMLAALIGDVIAMNLHHGVANSLDAKLDSALNSLEDMNDSNDSAAIGSLGAFVNAVEAQRGKKIPEAEADALIAAAEAIIALLEA